MTKHSKQEREEAILASKTVECPKCQSMHKSKDALRKHLKICKAMLDQENESVSSESIPDIKEEIQHSANNEPAHQDENAEVEAKPK